MQYYDDGADLMMDTEGGHVYYVINLILLVHN